MDGQAIANWVQSGGLVALAIIMTSLHVYDVRYTFPQLQQQFHEELQRERAVWASELNLVRCNTERRQQEMILELRRVLDKMWRHRQEVQRGKRMEDGSDPDTAA